MCNWNRLMLCFLILSKTCIFDVIRNFSVNGQKRFFLTSKCSFSRFLLCKLLNKHWAVNCGHQKNMIDISTFWAWDPVTGTCINLTYEQTLDWQLLRYFQKSKSHLRWWFQLSFGFLDPNRQVRKRCKTLRRICVYIWSSGTYFIWRFRKKTDSCRDSVSFFPGQISSPRHYLLILASIWSQLKKS